MYFGKIRNILAEYTRIEYDRSYHDGRRYRNTRIISKFSKRFIARGRFHRFYRMENRLPE